MCAAPDDAVEKMPYYWRLHAHMTRLKMGIRNFNCTHALAVGDHVTDQFGGPGNFVGEVVNPDAGGKQVEVRWLSDHIGPPRTTKVPRHRLVKADYAPPRDFDERAHGGNNSSAWLLRAAEHGWHVADSGPAYSATEMSKGCDGWADAWLGGTKVSIRFNAAGEITWTRIIGDHGGGPYVGVKQGRGAGHTAMRFIIPRHRPSPRHI
jgi:hypothetical protein